MYSHMCMVELLYKCFLHILFLVLSKIVFALLRHGGLSPLSMSCTIITAAYVVYQPLQLMNYFKGLKRVHFLIWRGKHFTWMMILHWIIIGSRDLKIEKFWCSRPVLESDDCSFRCLFGSIIFLIPTASSWTVNFFATHQISVTV